MTELEKYQGIYSGSSSRFARYGHSNHGAKALPILKEWKAASVLDVGCGHNEFAKLCRAEGISATGVDFACPSADVVCDATKLPFTAKSFDVVTAFDMLEHVREEDVDATLNSLARVATRFIFSISYQPSVYKWEGQTLHPTVQPESWWIRRLARAGATHLKREGRYLTGQWNNPAFPVPRSCVLVGNGPSVLQGNLGPVIDAHEEVVRFNTFHLTGFEAHTGKRTTLWSTFGRGTLPFDEDQRPDRVLFIHGESGGPPYDVREIFRIPRFFFNDLRALVQKTTLHTGEARERLIPSSGLLVAWWLLEVCGLPSLTLAGFDHFRKARSAQHHYWIPRAFGRPKEHDGDAEAKLFAAWEAAARLHYLTA